MQMEEQILAEGCRKGDDMARKELYDRYAGRLLSICMRYAGDRATAEDLLHDAFLKIYGAFDRFTYRGTGSLRAWIERITVNVALEWIRSRSKLGSVTLDEGKAAAEVAEPDVAEMARVPREVLMRFIGELPEGYRAVFNSTASRSIPTATSPGCWESTRKAPLRSCFAPGPCWPAGSGLIWRRIEIERMQLRNIRKRWIIRRCRTHIEL